MELVKICDELTIALRNNENVEMSMVVEFLTAIEEEKQLGNEIYKLDNLIKLRKQTFIYDGVNKYLKGVLDSCFISLDVYKNRIEGKESVYNLATEYVKFASLFDKFYKLNRLRYATIEEITDSIDVIETRPIEEFLKEWILQGILTVETYNTDGYESEIYTITLRGRELCREIAKYAGLFE